MERFGTKTIIDRNTAKANKTIAEIFNEIKRIEKMMSLRDYFKLLR